MKRYSDQTKGSRSVVRKGEYKRRKLASGSQGDPARGGVEDELVEDSGGHSDGGNFVNQPQQTEDGDGHDGNSQQQQQVELDGGMIGNIMPEMPENQLINMTDWDFSET